MEIEEYIRIFSAQDLNSTVYLVYEIFVERPTIKRHHWKFRLVLAKDHKFNLAL